MANTTLRVRARWCVVMGAALLNGIAPGLSIGEIIVDGFDDAFEIVMPEMDDHYIIQSDIGALSAERWSQVNATSGSAPMGRADANITVPSALSIQINRLNPHPIGGPPAVGVNVLYLFDDIDITQGGVNDRVVLDFAFMTSAIPLQRVTSFIQDRSQAGVSYGSLVFDIPSQNKPFSLEFPLDSFNIRGGGAGKIDYRNVYRLSVSISPVRFNDINNINFSAAVERIRITGSIPEPTTGLGVVLAIATAGCFWARKRRIDPCGSEHFAF